MEYYFKLCKIDMWWKIEIILCILLGRLIHPMPSKKTRCSGIYTDELLSYLFLCQNTNLHPLNVFPLILYCFFHVQHYAIILLIQHIDYDSISVAASRSTDRDSYVTQFDYSPFLRGYSLVLNTGKAAFAFDNVSEVMNELRDMNSNYRGRSDIFVWTVVLNLYLDVTIITKLCIMS